MRQAMVITAQDRFCMQLRRFLFAGLIGLVVASPVVAQDASRAAVDGLFVELRQLQDANIGIARQMADTQRRAAVVLETALAKSGSHTAAHREIIESFIANARTLAAVVLAPIATQDVAAADAFARLLEENIALVRRAQPALSIDDELSEAVEQYAAMQMQTQDLGFALMNGWNRYGRAVSEAEAAGLLPVGSFDPAARDWTIKSPDSAIATASAAAEATMAAEAEAEPVIGEEKPVDVAVAEPPPATPAPLVLPDLPEPTVAPQPLPVAEAEPPEPEPVAEAEPPPETPAPEAPASSVETASIDPVAEPESGAESDRLPAGQPLSLAEPGDPAAVPPAMWMVAIDDSARAVATAGNANPETATRIKSMRIGCHPNGTLRYIFDTDGEIVDYLIFADDEQSAEVRAQDNIIAGDAAIRMSDVLRLAFEYAESRVGGRITIANADAPAERAYFPVAGYLEARGRVLDGCLPWQEAEETAQGDADPAAAVEAESAPAADATPSGGEIVAPIPRPRPANRTPVDLLSAG